MSAAKKIVIIGGVAGGASAAARARRLSEDAEIILIERGPAISYANCGMPYYIGGVITERKKLLVQTAENFKRRFRVDVRVNTEAMAIDRTRRVIRLRDVVSQQEKEETYDALILSPGAEPIRPALPGIDLPGIFALRSLEDMDRIQAFLATGKAHRGVVVGGGFIGLEMAEALRERGLNVTLVEMAPQVLNPLDSEMASPVHQQLEAHGVSLQLGVSVQGFSAMNNQIAVRVSTGEVLETDMVILAIGVKPEVHLACIAGLSIGDRGGIVVDEHMRTSDPAIFAVGDAVETMEIVGQQPSLMPLAGPANRQGRIAADNALGQTDSIYRGSQGTAICKIFDLAAGSTGLNEKSLKRIGQPYAKVYVHPASHASYYPGAHTLSLKLLYHPQDGRILGAQVVGSDGVDKRLDVLATALRGKMTVFDLEHLELTYAPPYGSAKDPVNFAGFVAANSLRNTVAYFYAEDIATLTGSQVLLDVRTVGEVAAGTITDSLTIPVDNLRERLAELPRDREIMVFCQVGIRSYLAARILQQHGWKTKVLTGGFTTYRMWLEAEARAKSAGSRKV